MADFEVRIPPGLRRDAAALRSAYTVIERDLQKAMGDAAKPVIAAARRNARSTLPARGGLAGIVAGSRFTVRRVGRIGVRIETNDHDKRLDSAGRVRHPTYGHEPWREQRVRPGWFTQGAKRAEKEATAILETAAQNIAHKIEGGL